MSVSDSSVTRLCDLPISVLSRVLSPEVQSELDLSQKFFHPPCDACNRRHLPRLPARLLHLALLSRTLATAIATSLLPKFGRLAPDVEPAFQNSDSFDSRSFRAWMLVLAPVLKSITFEHICNRTSPYRLEDEADVLISLSCIPMPALEILDLASMTAFHFFSYRKEKEAKIKPHIHAALLSHAPRLKQLSIPAHEAVIAAIQGITFPALHTLILDFFCQDFSSKAAKLQRRTFKVLSSLRSSVMPALRTLKFDRVLQIPRSLSTTEFAGLADGVTDLSIQHHHKTANSDECPTNVVAFLAMFRALRVFSWNGWCSLPRVSAILNGCPELEQVALNPDGRFYKMEDCEDEDVMAGGLNECSMGEEDEEEDELPKWLETLSFPRIEVPDWMYNAGNRDFEEESGNESADEEFHSQQRDFMEKVLKSCDLLGNRLQKLELCYDQKSIPAEQLERIGSSCPHLRELTVVMQRESMKGLPALCEALADTLEKLEITYQVGGRIMTEEAWADFVRGVEHTNCLSTLTLLSSADEYTPDGGAFHHMVDALEKCLKALGESARHVEFLMPGQYVDTSIDAIIQSHTWVLHHAAVLAPNLKKFSFGMGLRKVAYSWASGTTADEALTLIRNFFELVGIVAFEMPGLESIGGCGTLAGELDAMLAASEADEESDILQASLYPTYQTKI